MAHVTTQSATKIHEMDANYAAQIAAAPPGGRRLPGIPAGPGHPAPALPVHHAHPGHGAGTPPAVRGDPAARPQVPRRRRDSSSTTCSPRRCGRPGQTGLTCSWRSSSSNQSGFAAGRRGVLGDFHVLGNVLLLTSPERARRVFDRVLPTWDDSRPGSRRRQPTAQRRGLDLQGARDGDRAGPRTRTAVLRCRSSRVRRPARPARLQLALTAFRQPWSQPPRRESRCRWHQPLSISRTIRRFEDLPCETRRTQ